MRKKAEAGLAFFGSFFYNQGERTNTGEDDGMRQPKSQKKKSGFRRGAELFMAFVGLLLSLACAALVMGGAAIVAAKKKI